MSLNVNIPAFVVPFIDDLVMHLSFASLPLEDVLEVQNDFGRESPVVLLKLYGPRLKMNPTAYKYKYNRISF